ncbi:hypothetical protein AB0B01_25920 [Streptomyces sp. NPDC044571]|uniref:hypothetical protein n=1 Tax=Streptomyces sp. NPDC044571 TaxID=3155371 RepID=UPI0033E70962
MSAIENGETDRTEVATLRSYVEALGGRLRVVAAFGDTEYTVARRGPGDGPLPAV